MATRSVTLVIEDFGPDESWLRDSISAMIRDWRSDYRGDGANARVATVERIGEVAEREEDGTSYKAGIKFRVIIRASDTGYGVEVLKDELDGAMSYYGLTKVVSTEPELR